jgi:hypothetical protein
MHKLLAVIAVFGIVTSATAADLPKEGTFKGTFTYVGTYKATRIGDRMLVAFDETGAQITSGFADHMAFHCWGTTEVANHEAAGEGHCVGTDPGGDLIETEIALDKHPFGKPAKGQATYVAGTGKFAGLSGTVALATEGTTAFKPITEGTYVGVTALDGHYKLP